MNKFKKKTRSKVIAASIAILSSAAVVSTGFAAWVISGGDSKNVSGTIKADAVSNENHLIDGLAEDAQSIVFGGPKPADITAKKDSLVSESSRWLKNDENTENLTASWTFNVAGFDKAPSDNGLSVIDITFTEGTATEGGTTFASAADIGYVAALPAWSKTLVTGPGATSGIYLVAGNYDSTNKKMPYTLTVVFTWGEKFGNMNPYFYYNQKAEPRTDKDSANTFLSELANMKANFTLTIKTN